MGKMMFGAICTIGGLMAYATVTGHPVTIRPIDAVLKCRSDKADKAADKTQHDFGEPEEDDSDLLQFTGDPDDPQFHPAKE